MKPLWVRDIGAWVSEPGYKGHVRQMLLNFMFNSLVALFLLFVLGNFWINFVISQCIGFSTFYAQKFVAKKLEPASTLVKYIIAILIGSVLGTLLAGAVLSMFPLPSGVYGTWMMPIYLGIFFGGIASYVHYSRGAIAETEAKLKQEENNRLTQEKQLAEAKLKMIQAQIEPHFLFNTLANINTLIASEPDSAQFMLQQLNQYLRTGLSRTRDGQMSLRHEIDLITAYLAIFKIRMGDRLAYNIDVDEDALNVFIPALLLQPVVENAIQHGLEPKLDGGSIDIAAKIEDNRLRVEINDSGIGQQANWNSGTGLSNIHDRIKAFYNGNASFNFHYNDKGTRVHFDLPVTPTEIGATS